MQFDRMYIGYDSRIQDQWGSNSLDDSLVSNRRHVIIKINELQLIRTYWKFQCNLIRSNYLNNVLFSLSGSFPG